MYKLLAIFMHLYRENIFGHVIAFADDEARSHFGSQFP